MDITTRLVESDDLPVFFMHQQDAEARHMAAFTSPDPSDRDAFDRHWRRTVSSDTVTIRTVIADDRVAGHVLSYVDDGHPEVSYWIGREFWGRGVATRALGIFLQEMHTRPMFARAASDNLGSIRVLEKNGFTIVSTATGFANARGQEIPEVVMRLDET